MDNRATPPAQRGKDLPLPCRHARSYLDRGVTVVELRGAIDLSAVPEVRAHTDAATAPPRAQVVVDLLPVDFLDCSALGLLCRARGRTLERDGRFALVCAHPWHLRILRLTRLAETFAPVPTVEDALEREPAR